MIAHCLSNTRTENTRATATSKAKMTKGRRSIVPLDADEDSRISVSEDKVYRDIEAYGHSFLSRFYQNFDIGDLSFPISFSSRLTRDSRPHPSPSFPRLPSAQAPWKSHGPSTRGPSSASPPSLGLLSFNDPSQKSDKGDRIISTDVD